MKTLSDFNRSHNFGKNKSICNCCNKHLEDFERFADFVNENCYLCENCFDYLREFINKINNIKGILK